MPGQIIILNGVPRSGKSTIASAIVDTFEGEWQNLGVDVWTATSTPAGSMPGIGLRPGGERPDLEPFVVQSFLALYEAIATLSDKGIGVVVDVGHHDFYSKPLNILPRCSKVLEGHPVLFVGVRCSLEEILRRREMGGNYLVRRTDGSLPDPILRWQESVHAGLTYDLEVDTTASSPEACVAAIEEHVNRFGGFGTQFPRLSLTSH